MRSLRVSCLVSVLLLVGGILPSGTVQAREMAKDTEQHCMCTMEYRPVCATKVNKTFGNHCGARCAGFGGEDDTTPGECPPSMPEHKPERVCVCSKEYAPVCATETGVTFGNPCMARCAGFDASATIPGPCSATTGGAEPKPCICTFEYRPVCATKQGQTFSNKCEAKCNGFEEADTTSGECPQEKPTEEEPTEEPEPCMCTREYMPVCATKTGQTFSNKCEAKCNGFEEADTTSGECPQEKPTEEEPTEEPKPCMCTREYMPVCATKTGQTFGNKCEAKCSGFEEADTTSGECPLPENKPEPCICTLEYMPVCATKVNKTFGNKCDAKCNGFEEADTTSGECPPVQPDPFTRQATRCEAACPEVSDPICVVTSSKAVRYNATTYANPCIAACNGAKNALTAYPGKCNATADAKCGGAVRRGSRVCAPTGVEYPTLCYAVELGELSVKDAEKVYKGQCAGTEAVLMAERCAEPSRIRCFADPCQVSTCKADADATCVSKYCPSFFRYMYLSGTCQAVWVSKKGNVVSACTAL